MYDFAALPYIHLKKTEVTVSNLRERNSATHRISLAIARRRFTQVLLAGLGFCAAGVALGQGAAPPSVPVSELRLVISEPLTVIATSPQLSVTLSRPLSAADGQIAAIMTSRSNPLQKIDFTQHLQVQGNRINLDFATCPLAPDTYELKVYRIALNGTWILLGTAPVRVANESPAGGNLTAPLAPQLGSGERPPLAVRFDIGLNAGLHEHVGGGQAANPRSHAVEGSLQGTVEGYLAGDDWETRAQIQLVGNSYRQALPSFGTLRDKALKIDIANYLAEAAWRDSRVSWGQVAVDTHPLLVSGINNRGIAFMQRLPLGFDFGLSSQSGEPLAGHRNLFGLERRESQHRVVGVGLDLQPEKPGYFRVDINAIDSRLPQRSFGNAPTTADEGRGAGGRVIWRSEDNRFRAEAIFAKTTFRPGIVPENFPSEMRGTARTFEAGYEAIRDWSLRDGLPFALTLGARSEYSSPFYRSLGSGYAANYQLHAGTATARLGALSAQLQLSSRYDNVGEDRIYIRNRVAATAFNLNLPIGAFFGDNLKQSWAMTTPVSVSPQPGQDAPVPTPPRPSPWLPALTFSQQFTHGFGDHNFVPLGYGVDDLPDVYVVNRALGFQWQFDRVTIGLRANRVSQTNRQIGSEQLSTRDRRLSASVDWRVIDTLSINLGYDPTYNYRFDTNVRTDARQLRGGLNWTINENWTLNTDLNHSADFDSLDTRYNRQNTSQVQLTHRFKVPIPGWRTLPGQATLRASNSQGFNFTAGSPVLEPSVRRVQLNVTMSVY